MDTWSPKQIKVWQENDECKWVTEISSKGYILQLIISHTLRSLLFSHLAGHMGRENTLMSVRRIFYWPCMSADICRWSKQCDACAQTKRGLRGSGIGNAPLTQFSVDAPSDVVLDIIGRLKLEKMERIHFSSWGLFI